MFKKLLIILLLLTASCGDSELLVSSVSEADSVQIMVVLQKSGIAAKRVATSSSKEARFKIEVVPSDYAKALNILHQYDLPKRDSDSLASVTEPRGFAPNPPEINSLRLDHALSLEIERMLGSLPGIIGVKTLVRSNFSEQNSKVSVVIRYTSDSKELPFKIDEVKNIILQSVPSLNPNNMQVSAHKISNLAAKDSDAGEYVLFAPFNFQIKKDQKLFAEKQLLIALGVFCFIGGIVGIILGWKFSRKDVARQLREAQVILESRAQEALPDSTSKE